jgi:hypothetical protein
MYSKNSFVDPSSLVKKLCQKAERHLRQRMNEGNAHNVNLQRCVLQVLRFANIESLMSRYQIHGEHLLHSMTSSVFYEMCQRVVARFLTIRKHKVLRLETQKLMGASDAHKRKRVLIFQGK